jgi:hypothetical protein
MPEREGPKPQEVPQIVKETGLSADYINEFAPYETALQGLGAFSSPTVTLEHIGRFFGRAAMRPYEKRYAAPKYIEPTFNDAERAAAVAAINRLVGECNQELALILADTRLKPLAKVRQLRAFLLPRFLEISKLIDPHRREG